jgi:predicted AlkP superfamily pyrophosphatase or phosphodiesterase
MQRIKALLTGSLPTFVDVASVFHGGAIKEDNIFSQAQRLGMRVGAIGDDTWVQLFPGTLNISYPYPSLNVKDLDTVDDGVARVRNHVVTSSTCKGTSTCIAFCKRFTYCSVPTGTTSITLVHVSQDVMVHAVSIAAIANVLACALLS